MQLKAKAVLVGAIATLALACAVPALAVAPTVTESGFQIADVDTETCSFPIQLSVDQARRTTTYSNGDVTRHVSVTVRQQANGHEALETDVWQVFIPATDPTNWKLTGRFTQVRLDGKLISLQTGNIVFDPLTGELDDPNPGPKVAYPDPCTVLAP